MVPLADVFTPITVAAQLSDPIEYAIYEVYPERGLGM